ncbi:putative MFS-type transporter YcnB [Halobacillus andaensis]|uniref:MFS-type transporter YcnB n=1 Tax=Halobacillus andaensis TaxID=1176239 RepID=A0A917EYM7_HALAA|nr:MDR family MFS transporter [Halobacillus andaensis]MBP2006131.1 EmrB/QacA subfamily drug resistance transporter [Halobacillus andaensis]GGF23413.1 putative MFS-type transporter YcnB [Halobacillus andaensis]
MAQNYSKVLIAALLISGSFITILNQTLMITAIPPIMEEMNITANTGQWLTTVFMLVNGIMIPISAFLIEKFTTRQLFMTAMGVFAAGTIVGGLATNFPVLLTGRIIQSAGAGVMLPLMQTVFLLIFPVEKRGAAMGYIGLVISFAPAIGPTLSGWVTANYSWRYLFWFIFPLTIIMIVIAYKILRNVTELKNPKVDPISIILSSFGFGGLLYGFTSAGNNGWDSPITIGTLAAGTIILFIFILRQLRMHHPMLEFRVFKLRTFTITTIIGMVSFMGLIGAETLIPLYMQNMRNFTALESGLVLLPGALISGLMSPITGRIFDRIGARSLAIVGLTIMTGSSLALGLLDTETSLSYLMIAYAIRMFGLSMVMMPVTTAGLNELPPKLIPHGAAMNNTMRQIAASVGTAILVTVMTTTAMTAEQQQTTETPEIFGVNFAFMVVTALTFIALILSIFVRRTSPPTDEEWDARQK